MNFSIFALFKMTVFATINKIQGIYALFLTIFGTALNIFSIIICLRIKKNATFMFLAFFSFFNIFTLYWWNLNNFLTVFTDFNLLFWSFWACKIGNYVQFTSLQLTAWFLVKFYQLSIFLKVKLNSNLLLTLFI